MRRCTAVAFAITLTAGANAFAQTAADPADPIIVHGLQLREQGHEREALAEFTRAWEMGHTPRARAQMALAEQALGEWVTAYEHMTEALDARTDPWITSRRSVLEEAYAVIRTHVGRLDIVSDPIGAEVSVDGVVRGRSPLPRPIALLAGPHVIESRMAGRVTTTVRVTIAPDASTREQVTLPPIAVSASSTAPGVGASSQPGHEDGDHSGPGAGPWIVLGAGVAVAAVGAVFLGLYASELNASAQACHSTDFLGCETTPMYSDYLTGRDHYNTAVTYTWIADAAFAVGGAAIGAGLVWYLVDRPRGTTERRAASNSRLRFFLAPRGDGAMVGVGGTM